MKKQNGTAAIILESETKTPNPCTTFNEVQRKMLESMSVEQQEEIKNGAPVIICDLATSELICEFNMKGYRPPESAIDAFARAILPEIRKFYSNPDNMKKFEEWKKKHKNELK